MSKLRLPWIVALGLTLGGSAHAQVFYNAVSLCGTPNYSYSPLSNYAATMNLAGQVCVFGTFTGTVTISGPLPAGTNVIGKVGIDQTTPGTTNAVQATNLPATADTNAGAAGANTLRVVTATGGAASVSIPVKLTNYGILIPSSTTASTLLTTATASPNSGSIVYPLPSGVFTLTNLGNSTSPVYVCPLGGTCSASVGIRLEIGEGRQWQPTTVSPAASPTIACGSASASACVLSVEE